MFDELRAMLGFEYSLGSWFWVLDDELRQHRGGKPFGQGKVRPVILATPLRPDAVVYPRSTKPARLRDRFPHGGHRHDPEPACRIVAPGWVILAFPARVDQSLLNEDSYSCEEPDGSGLLDAIRKDSRP